MLTRRQVLAATAGSIAATSAEAQAQHDANRILTRIAVGSCANQEVPQPIWDTILKHRPDLFIFAGDNVYGDVMNGRTVTDDDQIMASLQTAYAKAAAIPGLNALRAAVPHLATWDDHDYGRNDGGAEFAHKAAAQHQFAEFWTLPANDPRRTRPGVYHAALFGTAGRRVQVILLDLRSFRSPLKRSSEPRVPGRGPYIPDADPTKTMLGAAQWAWLEAQLGEPADVRLIVSSIETIVDGNTYERWANLPLEQRRLYELIAKTRASRVIFLSGDRHIGGIYVETRGTPYPLYEMTSSGLTHSWESANETARNRIGGLYGGKHFGSIDIDWPAGHVTLSLVDLAGAVVRSHTIKLAEITL
jgi:alkaline phosphatase D